MPEILTDQQAHLPPRGERYHGRCVPAGGEVPAFIERAVGREIDLPVLGQNPILMEDQSRVVDQLIFPPLGEAEHHRRGACRKIQGWVGGKIDCESLHPAPEIVPRERQLREYQ